jgi:hypothetical protein
VGLEQVAVLGEQAIGRAEEHALGGEGGIELLVQHVAVERGDAAGERAREPGGGGVRIVDELARQDGGREQALWRSPARGGGPPRPGVRLEHPQVGPHPVLVAPVGQREA